MSSEYNNNKRLAAFCIQIVQHSQQSRGGLHYKLERGLIAFSQKCNEIPFELLPTNFKNTFKKPEHHVKFIAESILDQLKNYLIKIVSSANTVKDKDEARLFCKWFVRAVQWTNAQKGGKKQSAAAISRSTKAIGNKKKSTKTKRTSRNKKKKKVKKNGKQTKEKKVVIPADERTLKDFKSKDFQYLANYDGQYALCLSLGILQSVNAKFISLNIKTAKQFGMQIMGYKLITKHTRLRNKFSKIVLSNPNRTAERRYITDNDVIENVKANLTDEIKKKANRFINKFVNDLSDSDSDSSSSSKSHFDDEDISYWQNNIKKYDVNNINKYDVNQINNCNNNRNKNDKIDSDRASFEGEDAIDHSYDDDIDIQSNGSKPMKNECYDKDRNEYMKGGKYDFSFDKDKFASNDESTNTTNPMDTKKKQCRDDNDLDNESITTVVSLNVDEFEGLLQQIESLKHERAEMEKRYQKLSSRNKKTETRMKGLKQTHKDLTKTYEMMQEDYYKMKHNYVEMQKEYDLVHSQFNDLEYDYKQLEIELNKSKSDKGTHFDRWEY